MFGQPDDQQLTATVQQAQNPSMLDNVSTQDLQGQATPAPTAPASDDPQAQSFAQQHPLTTDDPFVTQAPTASTPDPVTTSVASDPITSTPEPTVSASQPAPAPAFQQPEPAAPETTQETNQEAPIVTTPVDHEKLAGMKQEAMSHLEPLVDHINGTPEETFKTTMMMIQANDNHTLLDKALEAAKNIEDDKARAEALLDIINEINYFSQTQNPQE